MIRKEDFAVIKTLNQRGVFITDIATELEVHPRTISRALKRGNAPKRQHQAHNCKLEPYKPKIDQLLSQNVWNGVVIPREIQAEGYTGGYTMLRGYIAPKRSLRPSRATVRFACPGGLGQGDGTGPAIAD